MKCDKCNCPIIMQMKFYKHESGRVLCEECYEKEIGELKQCSRCGKWFKILYKYLGFELCTRCIKIARKELK